MNGRVDLPPGWTWATVEEISAAEPRSITDGPFGSNLKTEHYTTSGARVVRLQNIGEGNFRNDEAYISLEHFGRLENHAVRTGDVLIASLGDELPRACMAPDLKGPAIVKADCIRLRVHPSISAAYVMWALNSAPVRSAFKSKIHGLGRPRLNLTELRSAPIPLAPAEEQRRIVDAIDAQFSVIDATVEGIRTLVGSVTVTRDSRIGRLRSSILNSAFSGRTVPQVGTDVPAEVLLKQIAEDRAALPPAARRRRPGGSKSNAKPRAVADARESE